MSASLATSQTFESLRCEDEHGERWSARSLQFPLGYTEWRNFEDSIERAKAAAANAGHDVADHFVDATKMVEIGKGAVRCVTDYQLSRFGAYLVAMNGDPRKPEIAAAQTYFAIQTRKAEVAQVSIDQLDRRALARMVIEAEDARELAEAKVAELQPIAAVAEQLIASSGDYSVDQAAKILCRAGINTGERKLFATLKGLGWIIDSHTPYQVQINNGRLAVRASQYWHEPTAEFRVARQIRVTPKGLAALHAALSRHLIAVSS